MHGKNVKDLGFTLVELMITVAIVGIIAALGIPSFQEMLNQNRATSLVNELVVSLNLARSEAIKRGKTVTMCKSANIDEVDPDCSTVTAWNSGWVIFVDQDSDGVIDDADTRLKIGGPANNSASIDGGSNYSDYISYFPSGISKGNGNLSNGTLQICVDHVERSIVISTTGRLRIAKGTC
ncbi:GspH/FimT family pseudopilin [Methylomonas sp. MgM2]